MQNLWGRMFINGDDRKQAREERKGESNSIDEMVNVIKFHSDLLNLPN